MKKRDRERELKQRRDQARVDAVRDYQVHQRNANQYSLPPLLLDQDSFVERELAKWDRSQIKPPSGKYQDQLKINSEYQQRFAIFILECCPNVFEELRKLVPLYVQLFGEQPDKFHALFDPYKMQFLDRLQELLGTTINFERLNEPYIQFKTRLNNLRDYRHDFQLGESLGALLFARLLLPAESTPDAQKQNLNDATKYLEAHLFIERTHPSLPPSVDLKNIPAVTDISNRLLSYAADDPAEIQELITVRRQRFWTRHGEVRWS